MDNSHEATQDSEKNISKGIRLRKVYKHKMGIKNFYSATELAWEMRDKRYGVDNWKVLLEDAGRRHFHRIIETAERSAEMKKGDTVIKDDSEDGKDDNSEMGKVDYSMAWQWAFQLFKVYGVEWPRELLATIFFHKYHNALIRREFDEAKRLVYMMNHLKKSNQTDREITENDPTKNLHNKNILDTLLREIGDKKRGDDRKANETSYIS